MEKKIGYVVGYIIGFMLCTLFDAFVIYASWNWIFVKLLLEAKSMHFYQAIILCLLFNLLAGGLQGFFKWAAEEKTIDDK